VSGLAKQTRQDSRVLLFPALQSFAHTRHYRYINSKTRGDEEHMKLFLSVYRLLRAVYSSTRKEWQKGVYSSV